jgi:hypothetical protein
MYRYQAQVDPFPVVLSDRDVPPQPHPVTLGAAARRTRAQRRLELARARSAVVTVCTQNRFRAKRGTRRRRRTLVDRPARSRRTLLRADTPRPRRGSKPAAGAPACDAAARTPTTARIVTHAPPELPPSGRIYPPQSHQRKFWAIAPGRPLPRSPLELAPPISWLLSADPARRPYGDRPAAAQLRPGGWPPRAAGGGVGE